MSRRLPWLILLVCVAGFAVGLFELFRLRFETGDVYPPYSSLRADPLGTMVLCESLEQLPGLTVRRDFSATDQLPDGKDTTYLHLAATAYEWEWASEELASEIEHFLAGGGRLAITFFPETSRSFHFSTSSPTNSPAKSPGKKKAAGDKKSGPDQPGKRKKGPFGDGSERSFRRVSLEKRWGVGFDFVPLKPNDFGSYEPATVLNKTELPLPETLDWHSAMVFTNLDSSWHTIYSRSTNPVVIERSFGPGSVMMASDSYFLSNEAMRKDRHADLLAWVIGPRKHVLFDEAHFGIVDRSGIAVLMRKYRLHGLAAGLLLLAGLFIWKNAMSFGPPHPEEARQEYVAGKDAAAGFVNLLRRNIAPRDLLNLCFAEWTRSLAQGSTHAIERVDRAQALLEAENARAVRERDPVRTYQEICRVLTQIHHEH